MIRSQQPDSRPHASFQSVVQAASAIAILVGCLVLVGWKYDIAFLKSNFTAAPLSTKPNTALCLLLSGVSLWLLNRYKQQDAGNRKRSHRWILGSLYLTRAIAGIVAMVGLLTLSQHLFGWNLGIDQLLFQESPGSFGTLSPGRMGFNAALNFVLVGTALLLLSQKTRRSILLAQIIVCIAIVIPVQVLVGHAYGVQILYGIAPFTTQMALYTALTFIVLCVGMLCLYPNRGLMSILSSSRMGGWLVRRLLSGAIGIPLLLGWVIVWGKYAGYYDGTFAVSIFVALILVVFVILIWLNARLLDRIDGDRNQAEEALKQAHDELEKRVAERTAELFQANALLQQEISERQAALRERKQAEEVLRNIAEGVSAATGKEFFQLLVKYLAKTLETNYAFIGSLTDKTATRIRTVAVYSDGTIQDNVEYDLSNTPCERVVREQQMCCYSQGVQQLFPQDVLLAEMGIESYIGIPLIDSSSHTLGLMAVMGQKPLSQPQMVTSMLQIFAIRANAELERQQAEHKIREQAALLDITTDAIFVRDRQNRILFWNQGAEQLYGWQAAEVLGQDATKLLCKKIPTQIEAALKVVFEAGSWQGELDKLTKSGKEIIVASRLTLVRDEAGIPEAILAVDTDITEKKLLEKQFLRTQRLESLGILAGGIAHDLNNILTPILISSQLLENKLPDERSQQLLQLIETNTKRGASLVKQVLSFARGVEGKRVPIQIGHLLLEIEQIAKRTFPKSIEIQTDIPARELWTVCADATQLHQVFVNLCVNARDAMPDGGTLLLAAENLFVDENYTRMNLEAKVGSYVVVTIADTGIGIPPSTLERIFEPFFTTKEVGKGTGLGLSTVIGIVKSHGGFVEVESEVEKGSQFKVYLPTVQEKATQLAPDLKLPTGSGELILVVDDEPSIREITKTSLESHNYRVIAASDGIDAIALYARHKDEISLVLMDLMMPSMDGLTAIRTLQKINPQVKIIASSGLVSSVELAEAAGTGVKTFLSKPYTAKELLEAFSGVLGSR